MDVELPPPLMRPTSVVSSLVLPAVAALIACAGAARAQAPAQSDAACVAASGPDEPSGPTPDAARRPDADRADTSHAAIRLLAAVSADEVRFARSPRICVRLTGDARLDSVHVVARRNLASPVVAGTTYRNVYVAVEIVGRLNAECIAARITGAAPADSTDRCAAIGVTTNPAGPPRR